MLCQGEWSLCDDGIVRPIMRGRIRDGDGTWRRVKFLLDTGADGTVICANVLEALNLPYVQPVDRIGGVGGIAASVNVRTQIQLASNDGQWITFRGAYAACLQHGVLDMSVLGRDILNIFAVIVDRPADRVTLLHGADGYALQRRT
jgi:predicted aspartyl protease